MPGRKDMITTSWRGWIELIGIRVRINHSGSLVCLRTSKERKHVEASPLRDGDVRVYLSTYMAAVRLVDIDHAKHY